MLVVGLSHPPTPLTPTRLLLIPTSSHSPCRARTPASQLSHDTFPLSHPFRPVSSTRTATLFPLSPANHAAPPTSTLASHVSCLLPSLSAPAAPRFPPRSPQDLVIPADIWPPLPIVINRSIVIQSDDKDQHLVNFTSAVGRLLVSPKAHVLFQNLYMIGLSVSECSTVSLALLGIPLPQQGR